MQPKPSNPKTLDTGKHRATADLTQEMRGTNEDADIIEHLLTNKLEADQVNKMNNN